MIFVSPGKICQIPYYVLMSFHRNCYFVGFHQRYLLVILVVHWNWFCSNSEHTVHQTDAEQLHWIHWHLQYILPDERLHLVRLENMSLSLHFLNEFRSVVLYHQSLLSSLYIQIGIMHCHCCIRWAYKFHHQIQLVSLNVFSLVRKLWYINTFPSVLAAWWQLTKLSGQNKALF